MFGWRASTIITQYTSRFYGQEVWAGTTSFNTGATLNITNIARHIEQFTVDSIISIEYRFILGKH
jgi:hypothetical protein